MSNLQRKKQWLDHLTTKEALGENRSHFWGNNPSSLITASRLGPGKVTVGNSADLYASTIIPALESAKDEIIFVTCFWARSNSLNQLNATLIQLSNNSRCNSADNTSKLRVRLCFSSLSLTQKLFHTSSYSGHVYPPSKWHYLGLPSPSLLNGLDLQVKSLFFLPFCVMHPKFVIIDRQRALLPSCNLSWESWLECCVPVSGPAVSTLVEFWHNVWGQNDLPALPVQDTWQVSASTSSYETIILPSPEHRSPRFHYFSAFAAPPPTPLNTYLLHHFAIASNSIRIMTPNLTSLPVISALLAALERGVNVKIITNRRMMVLEQLFTAGTITEFCIWKFRRRYKKLRACRSRQSNFPSEMEGGQVQKLGKLYLAYYVPNSDYAKSHIKCTIIDEKTIVMGSGNLDRASWYTSQELGVALEGADVVKEVWGAIAKDFDAKESGAEWFDNQVGTFN